MNKKTSDPQYSHSETDGIKLLVKVQMDHNYQLNIYLFIYLFKLHITPIWVKQLQYKSMQTYIKKNKKNPQT